jgi:hypothetical protein
MLGRYARRNPDDSSTPFSTPSRTGPETTIAVRTHIYRILDQVLITEPARHDRPDRHPVRQRPRSVPGFHLMPAIISQTCRAMMARSTTLEGRSCAFI